MRNSSEPIPALGTLSRLPQELRDIIYGLSFYPPDKEVDVFSPCKPRSVLLLASKSLNTEVTALIARKKGWGPCTHTRFTFTVPSPANFQKHARDPYGENGLRRIKDHNLENTTRLRVITIQPGYDDPRSITLLFRPDQPVPDIYVYGASAVGEAKLRTGGLAYLLREFFLVNTGIKDSTKGRELEEAIIDVRCALHGVDRQR